MSEMVFKLFAITQEPQMFLSPAKMVLDAAPSPFVVGMFSYAVAHDAGDYFERLVEWLHETPGRYCSRGRPLLTDLKNIIPGALTLDLGAGIDFRRPPDSKRQA